MKNLILPALFMFLFAGCVEETEDTSGSLFASHRVAENKITLASPTPGIYVQGDYVVFLAAHPYNLNVTGNPRIALDVGGTPVYANYISGSGSKTLLFRYNVSAGHEDLDGISLASGTIDLNGGSILFTGTAGVDNVNTTLESPDLSQVLVDTFSPTISNVNAPASTTYYLGQKLQTVVTFSENVYVTGSPQVAIDMGGSTVYGTYKSGSGGTDLLFEYTVQSTDYELGGITVNSPLTLNGGSIQDAAGNDATLTFTAVSAAGVDVDGDTPYVDTFIPPANGVYEPGDSLEFSLQFTELVNVTGTPRVGIDIGGNIRYAYYISGSGTDTLLFRYSIVSGNEDTDGVDVENLIDLNGGTIQDAGGLGALLTMDAPVTLGATVDATLPAVTSITLPTPPADGYFNSGEEIYITLTFNDVVNVTGFPQLGMQLDSPGSTVYIDYNTGSGTDSLVFRYVVVDEADEDHDGFTLVSPLNLNGGTIQNDSLTNANLDFSTIASALDTSLMLVDATTPVVSTITPPTNGTYAIGDQVDFTVNFSEIVNVTGAPRLSLNIGGSTRYATYVSGSGSANLVFRWTVQNNDEDTDGIGINGTAIEQNGGTIIDRGGNETDYNISGKIPTLTSVLVDGIRPTISNIMITANTYTDGQVITASVTFDDNVVVASGSPTISATFDTAAGTPSFTYQSGSGSTVLDFEYTVQTGDFDDTGIALAASIIVGAATIQDVNGNDATLTHSFTSFPSVFVDAAAPSATITSPVNGDFINIANDGAGFAVTGTCDDATATYEIQIDGATAPGQSASCDGVSLTGSFNTSTLAEGIRSLTVVATDASANSSTSTAVSLDKDTVAPAIISVIPPAGANYTSGDVLSFTVSFNDTVTISGSRIAITLNNGTVYADYQSGSGTSSATYSYTVASSDYDNDGIALVSPLELNGGSILDDAGNAATLTYTVPGTGSITVNDGTPAFQWYDEAMNPVSSYNYMTPGTATTHTFTVENIGTAPTSASFDVSITTGGADFQEGTDNCSTNIIPINGTCTVQIEFRNIGTAGTKTGNVTAQDPGYGSVPSAVLSVEGTK